MAGGLILGSVLEFGGKLLERVLPDPAQRDEALFRMAELQERGELAEIEADLQTMKTLAEVDKKQLDVAALDAKSDRAFQWAARPAALWMCVLGLFYEFLVQPIGTWLMKNQYGWEALPPINTEALLLLASGLLGLGTLRTVDKWGKFRNKRG